MNQIIKFYSHSGTDNLGRTLKDMWTWSNLDFERTHNYIQWMFPTDKVSEYNKDAPLVDEETIKYFRASNELQSYLTTSSYIFENFLDLNNPNAHWLTLRNHNFLRITRVLNSLMILSCKQRAYQFLSKVEKTYKQSEICPLSFWNAAVMENKH